MVAGASPPGEQADGADGDELRSGRPGELPGLEHRVGRVVGPVGADDDAGYSRRDDDRSTVQLTGAHLPVGQGRVIEREPLHARRMLPARARAITSISSGIDPQ